MAGVPPHNDFDLTAGLAVLDVCLRQAGIASLPSPAFVVADTSMPDSAIVYVSDAFSALTGYGRHEILGRNCRFLQSPDGIVQQGSSREHVNDGSVHELKLKLARGGVCQHALANFKKHGLLFTNWITIVPIPWDLTPARFLFGFSCDISDEATSGKAPFRLTACPGLAMAERRHLRSTEASTAASITSPVADAEVVSLRHEEEKEEEDDDKDDDDDLLGYFDALFLVLSPRGRIMYASAACRQLGFEPAQLPGMSVQGLCHPADAALVLRAVRDTMLAPPSAGSTAVTRVVELMHRLVLKDGGHAWFYSLGNPFADEHGQAHRKVVLTCRRAYIASLSRSLIDSSGGGFGSHNLWARLAASGAILAVLSTVPALFGLASDQILGTTFQNMIQPGAGDSGIQRFHDMLISTTRQARVTSSSFLLNSPTNCLLEASVTMYPAQSPSGNHKASPSVILQSKIARAYPSKPKPLSQLSHHPVASDPIQWAREFGKRHARVEPNHSSTPTQETTTLPATNAEPTSVEPSSSVPRPEKRAATSAAATRKVGLAPITDVSYTQEDDIMAGLSTLSLDMPRFNKMKDDDHNDEQDQGKKYRPLETSETMVKLEHHNEGNQPQSPNHCRADTQQQQQQDQGSQNTTVDDPVSGDNGFGIWPLELHQLLAENDKLRAELTLMEKAQRHRKRVHSNSGGRPFSGCANCHVKQSPEWRRGPSGARDLCNRCGLRFAKTERPVGTKDHDAGKRKRD